LGMPLCHQACSCRYTSGGMFSLAYQYMWRCGSLLYPDMSMPQSTVLTHLQSCPTACCFDWHTSLFCNICYDSFYGQKKMLRNSSGDRRAIMPRDCLDEAKALTASQGTYQTRLGLPFYPIPSFRWMWVVFLVSH